MKKLGAVEAFDYRAKDVEDQVVKWLDGKTVLGAYHAVGADGAVQACARIVDRSKGKAIVVSVRGIPDDEKIPKSVRTRQSKCPSICDSAFQSCLVLTTAFQSLHLTSSRMMLGLLSGRNFCPRLSSRNKLFLLQNRKSWAKSFALCNSASTRRRKASAQRRSWYLTSREAFRRARRKAVNDIRNNDITISYLSSKWHPSLFFSS